MQLGGQSAGVTAMATKILELCYCLNMEISARYLAGKENTRADSLSQISPHLEWQLHPSLFRMLDRVWGRHTIDRFASMDKKQTPQYCTIPGFGTHGHRAWMHWLNRIGKNTTISFNLLPKVFNKIWQSKAIATVIAPWLPGRPWFQKLRAMSVDKALLLPKRREVIWSGGICPEPIRNMRWRILAWRVSGDTLYPP